MLRILVLTVVILLTQGCATYRGFPKEMVKRSPEISHDKLYYQISGRSIFKGVNSLHEVFKDTSGFQDTVETDTMPEQGYYVDVSISNAPPSVSAVVFGYISYSTFTILPFWSTQNGNNINYDLYKDGVLLDSHEYEIRRKLFVWILMLPLVWVNGITYNESEAFSASAYDFLHKANLTFKNKDVL